ncbi:F-box protein [Nymphaea thermarum]|nr:F-box protein [Nymphaea thermarum]
MESDGGMVFPPPKDRRPDALGDLTVLSDELLCAIFESLPPSDIGRLACVSSVLYIFCNEEPLWMGICLRRAGGLFEYRGTWKATALCEYFGFLPGCVDPCRKPMCFDGFSSMFLYKRWYRCFTALDGFSMDIGKVERKTNLTLEEFSVEYDGKKPVLLTGLSQNWPAINKWTVEQLAEDYGDAAFRISQRNAKKIRMKFKDYASYMKAQHDEDPLYVFDDKFGEVAPGLLKDYSVPHLFQEDFFDVLEEDKRPPFRWLVVGPERSGASWHVDPALTSAWNTLLSGRKRWALYPPGRVPLGVTVHVNEEDGDVNIETPSSLQWWLEFYPLLAEHEKPLECTQLPGETIFVPSGWWHCVLNLENSVAVTQNFVNASNFEFVCLDMTPGYHHKGVSRAGSLAIHKDDFKSLELIEPYSVEHLNLSDMSRKGKRLKLSEVGESPYACKSIEHVLNGGSNSSIHSVFQPFSYTIDYLSSFLDEDKGHYNSYWCTSNCIGQREFREWLQRLWIEKPGLRDLVWKGACIALDADGWFQCLMGICSFHNLPLPSEDEKLPVGTGSNPVYLTANHVIKIYVEGGLEFSVNSLGTELEFYSLLCRVQSPLKAHVPDVLASGFLFCENGAYRILPWNGRQFPEALENFVRQSGYSRLSHSEFGLWSKKQFEFRRAGINGLVNDGSEGINLWPYIITKKCNGDMFANLRNVLTRDELLNLSSFLGEQVRNLHLIPLPSILNSCDANSPEKISKVQLDKNCDLGNESAVPSASYHMEATEITNLGKEMQKVFVETMNRRKRAISDRLAKWGDPIPSKLVDKAIEYLPKDFARLFDAKIEHDGCDKFLTWIHMDIMDDNVYMERCLFNQCLRDSSQDANKGEHGVLNVPNAVSGLRRWQPSYILDFGDLSVGDPLLDLIPIYLDVFRGDSLLFEQFLKSYRLPLITCTVQPKSDTDVQVDLEKFKRISYRAMCYCILHEDNVLGVIFDMWKELRKCESWEEVEAAVWGCLNNYQPV